MFDINNLCGTELEVKFDDFIQPVSVRVALSIRQHLLGKRHGTVSLLGAHMLIFWSTTCTGGGDGGTAAITACGGVVETQG
jgi:hypothetical protein